ncbi:MAG: c-type cytochrome [Gammaproteobacteria bacterium]|nr:c-type cytochrome [Gammaproteobacteria bacterium]
MSSAHEDDTQANLMSPQNATVLVGLLLLAVIVGEVLLAPADEAAMPVEPTAEEIAMRIEPVVSLADMRSVASMASVSAGSANQTPDQMYQSACLACHTTGAAGAPKIGDAGDWTERLGKGLDALVASAINGIGAMPARGGSQLDDGQIRAVVEYILDNSK